MPKNERRSLRAVFAIPAVLGVSTLFGLLAALLGEGTGMRWVAWLAVAAPLAVVAGYVMRALFDRSSERRAG